jgi:hypothetical protein
MKTRMALLNSLLQALVDEWGHEEVPPPSPRPPVR